MAYSILHKLYILYGYVLVLWRKRKVEIDKFVSHINFL